MVVSNCSVCVCQRIEECKEQKTMEPHMVWIKASGAWEMEVLVESWWRKSHERPGDALLASAIPTKE